MRIEYLAAIAIVAVAAGVGLAVHSVGSLPPEKQSTPAATQLATLLAESRGSVFASVWWLTFGTMKARMGATHFLAKTLPKVAAAFFHL